VHVDARPHAGGRRHLELPAGGRTSLGSVAACAAGAPRVTVGPDDVACIGFTYYVLGLTDHLSYNIALAIGIGLGTLFRFWSYRKWVWAAKTQDPPPPQRVLLRDGSPR